MSNQVNSGSLYLPKPLWLKGEENLPQWKVNMKVLLGTKGLAHLMEKPLSSETSTPKSKEEKPETPEKQAKIDTLEMNRMIVSIAIRGSVHPEPSAVIEDVINPVEIIQLLEESYTAKGWNLKHKYLTKLFQIKAEHFDSIRAFINQFKALKSKLDQLRVKLPEEAYTVLFIDLFDTQYSVWADRQRSNARSVEPKLNDLIADILNKARKAEKATTLYSGKPGKKDSKGGGNKGSDKQCDHYSKKGHDLANY